MLSHDDSALPAATAVFLRAEKGVTSRVLFAAVIALLSAANSRHPCSAAVSVGGSCVRPGRPVKGINQIFPSGTE